MERPPFARFDPEKAVRVYIRNLPHWRQVGATYFVTFRLVDALPEPVMRELEYKRDIWLEKRGIDRGTDLRIAYDRLATADRFQFRKYVNRLREEVHDEGHGNCWLNRLPVLSKLREQLFRGDGEMYDLGDFVLMPNHAHLLITPRHHELEQCMRSIKGASSRYCNEVLGVTGTFWQADSFDHIVRDLDQLNAYRDYIKKNPEKAGIKVFDKACYRANWIDRWF